MTEQVSMMEAHTEGSGDRKQVMLACAVKRFVGVDLKGYGELKSYNKDQNLNRFAIFLISKIDEKKWQELFESCIPLLKKSFDFLQVLLPYLVYYSLRFGP